MNAAVGAAAADVPVADWMFAALPTQIVNEPFVFFFSFFCAGTRQVWRGGTTGEGITSLSLAEHQRIDAQIDQAMRARSTRAPRRLDLASVIR